MSAEEEHVCTVEMPVDEPTLRVARGVGTAHVAKGTVELMSSSGTPRYLAYEA